MSLLLNAMQKAAAEDRSTCCLVCGKSGTGKTVLLTEKARLLHETANIPYDKMAVIFQSERDASQARAQIINAPAKDGASLVSARDLRFFGTFLSVSYELLRENLALGCLDWFHSGFTVMDSEQEFDIAARLMAEKDYGLFKNNLRLKVSRAVRGLYVGSEEENVGLKALHDDLISYLRENRIIIRDKLPEWAVFLAGQENASLPSVFMVDNIHRTCEVEWKALMALAKRASENTFTLDPTFKVNTSNESGPAEDAVPDSYPTTKRFIVDHVLALQNVMATNIITLEHNYRLSQLPLVGANFIAGDVEAVKEGMPTPSGTIGLTSFADSREAAISIATQIEELRIRGAQYAEIGILYADGFMQKTLPSVLREKNIPFESGLGDYLGAFSGAAWLVRVLRFSLSPVNSASGADAVYDRKFGDVGLRRGDSRNMYKGVGERIPSRSVLFQKMRWFVTNANEAENALKAKSAEHGASISSGLKASWIKTYFDLDNRLNRIPSDYEQNLKSVNSVIDTIEALRIGGKRSLLQAIAQFLCNYNVRGRYALMRPSFPNCVHLAHYKVDTPYNFPFLFVTDCNDGKISAIVGNDATLKHDREALYTAFKRCSFELMLSYTRTKMAKSGLVLQITPSPLLASIPEKYLTCDSTVIEALKAGRNSVFPEESLVSYEDFMARFDEKQLALIQSDAPLTLLNAPVGTGKTMMVVGRILYLNQVKGVAFRKMFVCCFSKRAVADVMNTILHIKGLSGLSPVLDFPLFGTFESLCVKLLNKRLKISEYGYGRGFKIQKEEIEFNHAMELVAELKGLDYTDDLARTTQKWLEAAYRHVYGDIWTEISTLCGADACLSNYEGETEALPESANDQEQGQEQEQDLAPGFDLSGVSSLKANATLAEISADPAFSEFVARTVRFKKDNNIMSMRDARCIAMALVGDIADQISEVVVDEFQDFDALQLGFINKLVQGGARLMAVADSEQAINEWKTHGLKAINCLAKEYDVQIQTLIHNYRNELIAKSAHAFLEGTTSTPLSNAEGSEVSNQEALAINTSVRVIGFADYEAEINYVAARMLELNDNGVSFKDMAVLFKAPIGAQRILQSVLEEYNIPINAWSIRGRGIAERNSQGTRVHGSVHEMYAQDDEGVSLLSLHRCKGLEYPYVFIIDCVSSIATVDQPYLFKDNERHLYYVGMTRASKGLDVLYVKSEAGDGQNQALDLLGGLRLEMFQGNSDSGFASAKARSVANVENVDEDEDVEEAETAFTNDPQVENFSADE